jgi:hypothetical protein
MKLRSGSAVMEETDAGFFEGGLYLREGGRARADFAVEGFHAAYGAAGDAGTPRQFQLLPADEHARRAQLPAGDHGLTLAAARG